MAVIYATLIVKGKKTFDQVPERLQAQVREILVDLEVPEFAEQEMEKRDDRNQGETVERSYFYGKSLERE